jgi:hypothetical protein
MRVDRETTRPTFWKLLAGRPVLGQPDRFTKDLIRRIVGERVLRKVRQAFPHNQALTCTRLAT